MAVLCGWKRFVASAADWKAQRGLLASGFSGGQRLLLLSRCTTASGQAFSNGGRDGASAKIQNVIKFENLKTKLELIVGG